MKGFATNMVKTSLLSLSADIRPAMKFRSAPSSFARFSSASANMNENSRLFPEEVNIIYDSKCNVCKLEIDFLARRDSEKINIGAPKLKMTDLEDESYNADDPANAGITYKDGLAAIHAVTSDGKIIKGVPVFALAYEKVQLGWLFKITTWPIVKQIVDIGYRAFAKYRTNLTRGASIESLVQAYEAKRTLKREMDQQNCDTCESKK